MSFSLRPRLIAVLAVMALPSLALAHPGHDDPGITWEFSHLAAHPVATLGCLAVLAFAGWLFWRAAKRSAASKPNDRDHTR